MTRLVPALAALTLGACAANFGAGRHIDVTTVALRAEAGATPGEVGEALRTSNARAAIVASAGGEAWFRSVAEATELHLSGPAAMDDLEMAFLGPEPVGDTTLTLAYEGGTLTIHDALYEIAENRLLDLIAFRLEDPAMTREAMGALLEYVATDVDNAAALVLAVVVPDAELGDSVARMLSPAYYDAQRCEPGATSPSEGFGIRMFYGPEARVYCEGANIVRSAHGPWVRANLVMGRR